MNAYMVGIGHDVAEVDLVTLDPQPHSMGIRPTVRKRPLSAKVYEDALYVEFDYGAFEDEDQYMNVLEDWGLDEDDTANVTIYCRGERRQWVRKNVIAARPEMGKDIVHRDFFIRNGVILCTDLEDPA